MTRSMRMAFAVPLAVVLSCWAWTACISADPEFHKRVSTLIDAARTGPTIDARGAAANELYIEVKDVGKTELCDQEIEEIILLLDIDEEPVRGYAALVLFVIGPRAEKAVPKLLALLSKTDCIRGELTSGMIIRETLKRMGVNPPPPDTSRCPEEKH